MKRSTAVRHLLEMAETAGDHMSLGETSIGWPLEELWVAGEYLEASGVMGVGSVVLLLDVPSDELPWKAIHPAGEAVGYWLRLGKRPSLWRYRSMEDPPWSHEDRRVARIWSATGGLESATVEALRSGELAEVDILEPAEEQLVGQLRRELPRSREHLRWLLDRYWDHDWRREHRPPDDHLWRAASAVSEMQDALDELQP